MIDLLLPGGPLRLLCLAAHPDDIEIGCGGTLLRLGERADLQATFVTMTGDAGRQAEAARAAAAFLPGATSRSFDLPDGRLPQHWGEVKRALEDLGATTPADLVLAPGRHDAHQDHRLLAELVTTVWRDSLVLEYEIPKWDGDLGRPNTYVALTPELAHHKVALLNEHYGSQRGRDWWDDEAFLALMRLRGVECRSRYAEAFVVRKATIGFSR